MTEPIHCPNCGCLTGVGLSPNPAYEVASHEIDERGALMERERHTLQRLFNHNLQLRTALMELSTRVHSGYDFNADSDNITKLVGDALR